MNILAILIGVIVVITKFHEWYLSGQISQYKQVYRITRRYGTYNRSIYNREIIELSTYQNFVHSIYDNQRASEYK